MDLALRGEEIFVPPSKGGARDGAGRKPGSRSKNARESESTKAPLILNQAEEKQYWRDCLAKAVKAGNVKEQREILQYINEMRRGKPYTATNPRDRRQQSTDNRLMIAIQNLIPGTAPAGETRARSRKTKQRKLKDKTK